ncbi:MAG: GNAT family N-acetyltransferase [Brockia lithotrophica]|nr:GNAT family N-acetyltransferase [Brockia lithotrophica]
MDQGRFRAGGDAISISPVADESATRGCFAVRREVFVEEQGVPEELEWDEVDRQGGAVYFAAVAEGAVIGCLRLRPLGGPTLKVERLAVRAPWRGRGVGSALMEAAERWAQERGYRRLIVHAQVRVVDFYLRLGYAKIPRPPFEEAGILHVAMEKALSPGTIREGLTGP